MALDWLTLIDWGGSVAAAISIVFLFRKSLGYWYVEVGGSLEAWVDAVADLLEPPSR